MFSTLVGYFLECFLLCYFFPSCWAMGGGPLRLSTISTTLYHPRCFYFKFSGFVFHFWWGRGWLSRWFPGWWWTPSFKRSSTPRNRNHRSGPPGLPASVFFKSFILESDRSFKVRKIELWKNKFFARAFIQLPCIYTADEQGEEKLKLVSIFRRRWNQASSGKPVNYQIGV